MSFSLFLFDTVSIPDGGSSFVSRGHPIFISSKNWPRYYPNREDRTWTLTAPVGNYLNVTFLYAAFESGCYDKVYIYEGEKRIYFSVCTLQEEYYMYNSFCIRRSYLDLGL